MRDDPTPAADRGSECNDLLGRLEAHACMHDDLVLHDPEQKQWAADLRAAKAEIERLRAELAEAVTALPQAVRNERERCIEACRSEYLEDPQPTEGDTAYTQALDTLTHIIGMRHLSYIGQAMAESAERTLRTAIAEAEKTHCRYPECVENEREECQQCYQQALEDAARMLMAEHERRGHNDNHALFFAHKVRALGETK